MYFSRGFLQTCFSSFIFYFSLTFRQGAVEMACIFISYDLRMT